MIKNDVQLGKPMVVYTGLKTDLEDFTDAGMVGYASDTGALGWYAGSDWAWLDIAPGKTLTVVEDITLNGPGTLVLSTDLTNEGDAGVLSWGGAYTLTINGTGTAALTSDKLSAFAATTSAELAGVISDETGSGSLVFATSPSFTTPTLGVATATSINKVALTTPATGATLTIADGKTLTVNENLTSQGAAGVLAWGGAYTMTIPETMTVAGRNVANTYTAAQMIDGTADAIQLRVQGHSTQTSVLQTWENSSGEVAAQIYNSGAIQGRRAGDHATDPTPTIGVRRARGTLTSPTAVQNGNYLLSFYAGGYDGTNWTSGWNGGAGITAYATENWTTTARGAGFFFQTTPNGTTAWTPRLTVYHNGNIGIGTNSPGALLDCRGSAIFNEAGAAVDFRVESDNYDALFIDGANDSIDIMHHASGKIGFFAAAPIVRTAAYTLTNRSDDRAIDCNSTTTDELADVLATVIYDLQQYGLLQ